MWAIPMTIERTMFLFISYNSDFYRDTHHSIKTDKGPSFTSKTFHSVEKDKTIISLVSVKILRDKA